MIKNSKLRIQAEDDLDRAASLTVKLSHIAMLAKSVNLSVAFEFYKFN